MITGEKAIFAIESGILHAYESRHFKALGFFLIHVSGFCYGVNEPDATMMGCSHGEVIDRISRRGTHTAPFAEEAGAGKIADAFRAAIYVEDQEREQFFGIPQPAFKRIIYDNKLRWAPDGDEAFDDSSYVLQFDVGDRVRLIAFRRGPDKNDYYHDPATLRDLRLSADDFYGVLERWRKGFEAEWTAMPKLIDLNNLPEYD